MKKELRPIGIKLLELLQSKVTEKYSDAQVQISSEMEPMQMKLTYPGDDEAFQDFSENMETMFENVPVVTFDSYAQSKTIDVIFKTDDSLVEEFLHDFAGQQRKTNSGSAADQKKAQNGLKGLIREAGGKYNRHFKNLYFSTKRQGYPGILCVEIPLFNAEQIKMMSAFLKAIGLDPQAKELSVFAVVDTTIDYSGVFEDSFKDFFPETDLQKKSAKKARKPAPDKKALPAKPAASKAAAKKKADKKKVKPAKKNVAKSKKAAPKKIAAKKAAPTKAVAKKISSKKDALNENPQLTGFVMIFESLPVKDQKAFLARYTAKIAGKLKEALDLIQ